MSDSSAGYRIIRSWELKVSELTTSQKKEARGLLWGLGEKTCYICGKELDPDLDGNPCDIHHALRLGVEGCNFLPNLHLAHHACNAKEGRPKGIQTTERDKTPIGEPVADPTAKLREQVPYQSGSVEMQVNARAEVRYRRWLWGKIRDGEGFVTKFEAMHGGAEVCGVSPTTTRKYLGKLTSEEGPYHEFRSHQGKQIWPNDGTLRKMRQEKERLRRIEPPQAPSGLASDETESQQKSSTPLPQGKDSEGAPRASEEPSGEYQ